MASDEPGSVYRALLLLRRARAHSVELSANIWDFAVEAAVLRECGLTPTDFRNLALRGLIEHASETTAPSADERQFRPEGKLVLSQRSCFVLTNVGDKCLDDLQQLQIDASSPKRASHDALRGLKP